MTDLSTKIKLVLLTRHFYSDYSIQDYSEMLIKQSRPYVMFILTIDGIDFAIPFRSHIAHSNAFFTDSVKKCGIDYTKAVVINKPHYVDKITKPILRQNEFNTLKGHEYKVEQEFRKYLKMYKKAAKRQDVIRNINFCKYSTLQYFHDEIGV